MMISRSVGRWMLVVLVAAAAAIAGYTYQMSRSAPLDERRQAGLDQLMSSRLPDLQSDLRSVAEWRGKVIVVNFWATWCEPCREEIPLFVRLQQQLGPRGLQFIGIAVDNPQQVRPYAAELRMNFPVLLGGVDAIELTRALGNRVGALPYTVVIARDGHMAAAHTGIAQEDQFVPLLTSLF